MKYIRVLFMQVILSFIATSILAQNQSGFIEEVANGKELLPPEGRRKFDILERNSLNKVVHVVNVKNLIDYQTDGLLPFRLPGVAELIVARATEVQKKSEEDFTWAGQMEDRFGQVILISEKGGIYGHISIDDKAFELHYLGDGFHALTEIDLAQFTGEECATSDAGDIIIDHKKGKNDQEARIINCNTPVRILVLFTANALAAVPNINQTATLAIQQINTAFAGSAIPANVRVSVAGPIQFPFVETTDFIADINNLSINANAQNLRNTNGADFVVLLTNGDYGGVLGIVRAIGPADATSFAIVQATAATTTFSFAHEAGHLFGGRHQQCPVFNNPGCDDTAGFAHGFSFGSNTSIMHQLRNGFTRQMRYSNPNVNFGGLPTGTVAGNHNSRQIIEQAPTVAAFRQFIGPLTASALVAKSYPSPGIEQYRCEAVATCGLALHTFEWRISTDGYSYGYPVSTAEIFTLAIPECSYRYMWLRITSSDSQTADHFFTVGTLPGENCNIARLRQIESVVQEEEKVPVSFSVFPNPASNTLTARYYLTSPDDVTISLIDSKGAKISTFLNGPVDAGFHENNFDTSSLIEGIYILHMQKKKKSDYQKVIIRK